MAHTFLLEIGLEEMPARTIYPSEIQLKERIEQFLKDKNLDFKEIKSFSTPRRLAVEVSELSDKQPDEVEEVKGPAKRIALDEDGNWSKAAIGFSKGQGASTDDIVFKEFKGEDYVYIQKHTKGEATSTVLTDLTKVITSLTFPVSMKWGNTAYKYIRPVHWIVALLDDKVIPFEVFDVNTSNQTKGHRFLGKEASINHADGYEETLEKESVIVNRSKRKQLISEQINQILDENNWTLAESGTLLDEVTDLVEYPTAFSAKFDKEFLKVPEVALETSMIDHQRYFPVRDKKSNELAPNFIGVRNGNSDHIDNVARGNEKVLSARLADAVFFYEEDQKYSIEDFVEQLKSIQFHEKLGSMYDKQERVRIISSILAEKWNLSDEDKKLLDRAASIYKFDLVSNMVVEFTKLQGIIGELYALERGEDPRVAEAIRFSYEPKTIDSPFPRDMISVCLSIAEKLDTLIHFFSINLLPTGSNDPFALRRQAAGDVYLIEDQQKLIDFKSLMDEIMNKINPSEEINEGFKEHKVDLFNFIKDRLDNRLQDSDHAIPHDIRQAVLHSNQNDLYLMIDAANTLNQQKGQPEYKEVVESLSRVSNLAEKADNNESINSEYFENESEKHLFDQVKHAENIFEETTNGDERYQALKELSPVIDQFFDNNMVMAEDPKVKANRLALLKQINQLSNSFANLSLLVVK